MKKPIITISCISAILLSSVPPQAVAYIEPTVYSQTIIVKNNGVMAGALAFKRIDAKIVTTRPWLNPENKKFRFSDAQITDILRKAGFSGGELQIAKRIVFLESTNRPYALNKSSNCYGLFQINMTGSMGTNRRSKYGLEKNEDLFNPLTNAKIAYHMSNGGKDWSSWTTSVTAKKQFSN